MVEQASVTKRLTGRSDVTRPEAAVEGPEKVEASHDGAHAVY